VNRSKILIAVVVAVAAAFVACKQGVGNRCQIDDDCSSPLVCAPATKVCSTGTGTGIDASVPDAPIDAPDAM
jgi:hypothetical protein